MLRNPLFVRADSPRRAARGTGVGRLALVAAALLLTGAAAEAATFKVRLVEGMVPPGMSAPVQFLDHISINNNGEILLGVDTNAASNDETFYTASLKPFVATLRIREGDAAVNEPAVFYGAMDAINGLNQNGDFVFVSNSNPGLLDTVYKNGEKFVREGELLAGELVNALAHPQIDGTGTPWFLADIGGNSATDIAFFHGTTLLFREGDVVDGVPVASIVLSEATAGCNLRVNENGDYIMVVDDGDAQGQDVHIILNGENVLESGDVIPGFGAVYWFNQTGLTSTGNHWWVQLSLPDEDNPAFADKELMLLDGTTVLVAEDHDFGDGLTAGAIQTGSVNTEGHWIARVELLGANPGDDALLLNGAIIARTGEAVDAAYNWGNGIGLVNDIQLNDCGELALIADLVPAAGGSALESLVTGSIFDDGDVDGDFDIDDDDTAAFVMALLGTNESACDLRRADLNEDGTADGLDVQPFVDALLP